MQSNSINPFDDLYRADEIKDYFGIDAITRKRARLEIRYWKLISAILIQRGHAKITAPQPEHHSKALGIIDNFGYKDILKHLQSSKHEIKALEYTLRDKFIEAGIPASELIHWGLTSQDIVDPVYTIAIRDCNKQEIIPTVEKMLANIGELMNRIGQDSTFPARTHGQLAVPTTMYHELHVYFNRLSDALTELTVHNQKLRVKFGGAVGTLTVHKFVDPGYRWFLEFEKMFKDTWQIEMHPYTTQVNGNDDKARVFADLININNILIDMCQDIWLYCSYGYMTIARDNEYVGSSTMAQKNNPIEFENIEGTLQHVNSELHFMIDKLTRSRGQRDLTDSVVQRYYGLMFSQIFHAYSKMITAIGILKFNHIKAKQDVRENCQMYAELLQSLSKLSGNDRFEEIKWAFMNEKLSIDNFVEILDTSFPDIKEKIVKAITHVS